MLAAKSYEVLMAPRLFSISKLLLLSTILIGGATGNLTLLIAGPTTENDNKHSLASSFVHSYDEITKESPADLFVFANAITTPSVVQNNRLLSEWSSHELIRNVTTLVVANVGIEQMSTAHLDVVQRFITNDSAVVAIEIGSPRIETRMLLERRVSCATRSSAYIASPNEVYFCNNASPKMLSNLRFEKPVYIEPLERADVMERSQRWLFWPNLFASAAKLRERTHQEHKEEHLDHQHRSHLHHRHHHHPHHSHHDYNRNSDEDVDEMVDKIMEDIVEQGGINTASPPIKEQNKVDKKQACKYRKSCYETGIKPVIDDNSIFNFRHWWPEKNEGGDEDKEDEVKLYNENENLPLLKLHCKYRRSCYQEHGIPVKDKFEDEERKKPVLAYKTVPLQHGKKKTLKEIAAEALKKVEESIEKAAKRPLVKIVEKQMTAMEEKLSEKLHCKYRKSCYETGEIPHIEENWSLPLPIMIFSTESVDSENNQINFDELEQLEKKLYCKYRKSCYETGVKPDVEPEIFINTLKDLTTIYQQVETRKPSLQEKCKYRKSCYETGIVPDINPKLEAVISKEVSSVIPTNTQDLRLLCKYRKSCYAEVHSSATVETIKLLRKRRQIEKELRRRKSARMKLHRKLRGEVQLGHHRKAVGRKTLDESIDDVKERNIKPLKISDKRKARKQGEGEQEEDVEIKERPDSESKKGKVKKSKPQIKQSDQPLATKSKETSPVKKERKGKKVKVEKEASSTTPTGSKEETDVTDFSKKEAKPEIPSPLKTELHAPEEQDTERASIGDDKKGKRFGKAVQTMSKLIEEMQQQQEQQKRKEFCKYRKSCYETGKRPEIKQSFHNLLEMFKDHVDRETDEVHVKPKTETEKKLDCKYRKTCYRTGEYPGTHGVKSGEVKSIHSDTKASHSINAEEGFKYDTKSNDSARIPPKEPRFHTEEQAQSDSVNMIGLERYKRSGKCSPYYYSCREILGLPPKERVPIGPNGRRLCRKKPLSSA